MVYAYVCLLIYDQIFVRILMNKVVVPQVLKDPAAGLNKGDCFSVNCTFRP